MEDEAGITYRKTPLVEVALSVQYPPPKGVTLAHLGGFWSIMRSHYPEVTAQPSIHSSNEDFRGHGHWIAPSLQLALTNEPECRILMTSSDDQWVIQLQRDRFVFNWRKRGMYPRFKEVLSRFSTAFKAFTEYLSTFEIASPEIKGWEVTYVNRIPKGKLWLEPSDWSDVFPGLWGRPSLSLDVLRLVGFQGQWVFDQMDKSARLFIQPRTGKTDDDPPVDCLLLNITAKGPFDPKEPTDNLCESIQFFLSKGNKLVVSAFDAISSNKAKFEWDREEVK